MPEKDAKDLGKVQKEWEENMASMKKAFDTQFEKEKNKTGGFIVVKPSPWCRRVLEKMGQ